MKYPIPLQVVPQAKRADLNDKILYLIENNLCDQYNISPADVFSAYTGNGGLHGLAFGDYCNFFEYTEAKKEHELGQFFSPAGLCKFLADCIKTSPHDIVGDLTAGMGNFFNFMPNELNCYGNEFDIKAFKVMKHLYPEAHLRPDDIRQYDPQVTMDVIFGNPPFNLKWRVRSGEYLSQLYYCVKAADLLKPGGILALIVPMSFLADDFSDAGMIKEMVTRFNFIYQAGLPLDTFKSVGVEHYATKIMLWQKKSKHIPEGKSYSTEVESLSDLTAAIADRIYAQYVKPVVHLKEQVKHKLFFENLQGNREEEVYQFKVRKLLFDIKRNPKLNTQYGRCRDYVDQYYTQKKPEEMKFEEWENIRITKEKVIDHLESILKKQHVQERDLIRLVKTNYGLRLKGYSEKNEQYLSRLNGRVMSFNEMVLQDDYPFEDKTYYALMQKKKRDFELQSLPFQEMEEQASLSKFLDDLVIRNLEWDTEIQLNGKQKSDSNKILQKRYGFLQWGQGSGKTVAGFANFLYRMKTTGIRNTFVVGPAIAIYNTWEVMLSECRVDFIRISNLEDISRIQRGQVVLITTEMLIKYQRHIKRYVQIQSQKVLLLFDEADVISNPASKRAKAAKNCFRKAKFKTLMTGTMTRNSIVEAFSQLELLYNNSINMLSECEYVCSRNKKNPEDLEHVHNEYHMRPIPAYMAGHRLFSASHIPEKITVFGVGQHTQDIFNGDVLRRLVDKTVITRTFDEIVGRRIYEIYQTTCRFHEDERELYRKVIEEFYDMKYLFTSTGNLRKDRMLEILNQLMLMLKVCSIPHTFKEYGSLRFPSKFDKVFDLLKRWDGKQVAIGVRHKEAVAAYAEAIRLNFPDRPLFVITGDRVSVQKRKMIVKELQKHPDAILLSTQQSLSSSMNIGFIDKVIIAELSWNDASMSQYYFRFIRFNSVNDKEVHFVTYESSIESNLLGLILAKERLNLFMKNQELDDDELYDKYGVHFNLLDQLMVKERDNDGNVSIRWGQQMIV
ncbi:SNF2-related protein [Paenibacillus periandrae]|uniref:SNF2-related protein n=1 Tax=Paenibacillus periandrae TaxID=1761741 RepID=UPI001F096D85|nr:DEAD/DEAH box helicase family protein [Paenibacillus periandrae]